MPALLTLTLVIVAAYAMQAMTLLFLYDRYYRLVLFRLRLFHRFLYLPDRHCVRPERLITRHKCFMFFLFRKHQIANGAVPALVTLTLVIVAACAMQAMTLLFLERHYWLVIFRLRVTIGKAFGDAFFGVGLAGGHFVVFFFGFFFGQICFRQTHLESILVQVSFHLLRSSKRDPTSFINNIGGNFEHHFKNRVSLP